jgi:hypothetical protein
MKGRMRTWMLVVLTSWCVVGLSGHAQAGTTGNESLMLLGPVEAVDAKNGIAIVVGQKVLLRNLKRPSIGSSVAVFGSVNLDGSVVASAITSAGLYVSGASPLVITGIVRAFDPSIGRVTIGKSVIDFSAALSTGAFPDLRVGDLAQVGGTQPTTLGLVLASQVVVGKDGIIGGGLNLNGIIGGGSNGIIGGGIALNGIIGGGKAATDGIIGGGKASVTGIIGGGR